MKEVNGTFGGFVKELRLNKKKMGLREFCLENGHDPSNWSKLERGKLPPPNDTEILEKWANQLDLKKGDSEWFEFFDLAALEHGKIPQDIMSDAELVDALPIFFRTVRGQKPSKEDLKKLAELLRRA